MAGGGGLRRNSAFSKCLPDTGVAAERRMEPESPVTRQTSPSIYKTISSQGDMPWVASEVRLYQQLKILLVEEKGFGQAGSTAGETATEHFDCHIQASLEWCF